MDYVISPAIVISVCALLFTILSFWWINRRKGKLHVGAPSRYGALGAEAILLIDLPLTFFNDGPIPIVVHNLRLIFIDEKFDFSLRFEATLSHLGGEKERHFSTQFPISGKETMLVICEFRHEPGVDLEARSYRMEVQAQLNDSKEWKSVCPFVLTIKPDQLENFRNVMLIYDA